MNENLELRRAALEASGWTLREDDNGYWYIYDSTGKRLDGSGYWNSPKSYWIAECPAVESDPAASESWFRDLCWKNGWAWTLEFHPLRQKTAGCGYSPHHEKYELTLRQIAQWKVIAIMFGKDESECRAHAAVEALRKA